MKARLPHKYSAESQRQAEVSLWLGTKTNRSADQILTPTFSFTAEWTHKTATNFSHAETETQTVFGQTQHLAPVCTFDTSAFLSSEWPQQFTWTLTGCVYEFWLGSWFQSSCPVWVVVEAMTTGCIRPFTHILLSHFITPVDPSEQFGVKCLAEDTLARR